MSTSLDARLRAMPLFKDLTDKELDLLAMVMKPEGFQEGQIICKEGEPGRCCYFIVDGEVDVVKTLDTGENRVLATLRPHDVFGQISLIDAGPRSATCRARTRAAMFRLDRQDFDTLFSSGSKFAFRFQLGIARIAAHQLREANRRLNLLITPHRKHQSKQREEMLSEVREILARSDSQSADMIRWLD